MEKKRKAISSSKLTEIEKNKKPGGKHRRKKLRKLLPNKSNKLTNS